MPFGINGADHTIQPVVLKCGPIGYSTGSAPRLDDSGHIANFVILEAIGAGSLRGIRTSIRNRLPCRSIQDIILIRAIEIGTPRVVLFEQVARRIVDKSRRRHQAISGSAHRHFP